MRSRNDGVTLEKMIKRSYNIPCEVLPADLGYDCRDNEEIAVFRPIGGDSCYKSSERINLFLRWLFYHIIGLYDKGWIVKTVISVIKCRFGDRIKSRSLYSKLVVLN